MAALLRTGGDAFLGEAWLVDDLVRVEELLRATAGASPHPLVSDASLHLLDAGGKRLRPALVLVAARGGEAGRRETDLAAAALELVHLATLYHDDVLDGTQTRRGVATVHARWGIDVAILAGDFLFACGSALGAEAGGEVPALLANAIAQVCEGQMIETATVGDAERAPEAYMDVIGKKTAALFRAACELGASTAAAAPTTRAKLLSYGDQLGLAFQIVDDLLDLIGDQGVTGKRPGTDLEEGVFTLPVLLGCAADASLRQMLQRGERDLDDVLPRLRATGALEEAYERARALTGGAHAVLEGLPSDPWVQTLHAAADGVLAQVDPASVV